jgi:alanine racemase
VKLNNGNSNWLEIDQQLIAKNAAKLIDWTGVRLMAVVKANGYGHGIVDVVRVATAAGASYCGVARVEEAIELRKAGIQDDILVLGYTPDERLRAAIERDITVTMFLQDQVQPLGQAVQDTGKTARVHIKVDTGMSRLGAPVPQAYDLLQELSGVPGVDVEGIFTHFARADEPDDPTTAKQERTFMDLLAEAESAGLRPRIAHAANSAAALTRPSTHLDMVRIGIALFGMSPSPAVKLLDGMRPALAWKARLTHVETYPPNSGVSYGHHYRTAAAERIGVVPVGYGDGYRREPGNRVLIHGQQVKVVGRVCMDQLMVNLDELPQAQVGDEVVLIGQQGDEQISAEDLASRWGTFNYEVVCGLSARVPRMYS